MKKIKKATRQNLIDGDLYLKKHNIVNDKKSGKFASLKSAWNKVDKVKLLKGVAGIAGVAGFSYLAGRYNVQLKRIPRGVEELYLTAKGTTGVRYKKGPVGLFIQDKNKISGINVTYVSPGKAKVVFDREARKMKVEVGPPKHGGGNIEEWLRPPKVVTKQSIREFKLSIPRRVEYGKLKLTKKYRSFKRKLR